MVSKKSIVADNIHGNIELTSFEKRIISHVTFNRLHDIYQNSTVYLTFPCNRTKRFEHSLGTLKLCSDIFCKSIYNTDSTIVKDFLEYYQGKLIEILKKIKEIDYKKYEGKLGGRVRKIDGNILPNIKEKFPTFLNLPKGMDSYISTYYIILQSLRIVALLHDVGHPPYSHIAEHALINVKENIEMSSDENSRITEFKKIMSDFFCNEEKKLHEKMGDRIVRIILEDSIKNISESTANKNPDLFNFQVYEILISEIVEKILNNQQPFDIFHKIVDGTLDGDRLDYVTRDALNSGLDKGKIEYDRLFNGMILYKDETDNVFGFYPCIKSLNTVEDYLNRRWDIYKNIIFHHRVVKTDYLLKNVIEELCMSYLKNEIVDEQQENYNDLLPANISGLWKALKSSANRDVSYAISQWDDAWLITILKKHYFEDYIDSERNIKLSKQLEELLTNKKNYFSVIKRLEDFLIIDNAISKRINEYSEELSNKIDDLKKRSEKYKQNEKDTIIINPFVEEIEKILFFSKVICDNLEFQGLIFSRLRKIYSIFFPSDDTEDNDLKKFINDIINKAKITFPKNSIEDIFCVIKKYDIGLKKPLYFYNERIGKKVLIRNISSIVKILELNYDTSSQFNIYILKKDEYQDKVIELKDFLEFLGEEIANEYYNQWLNILEEKIEQYKIIEQKEN